MPQIINTNISSLNAQRNLSRSSNALNVSLERLSTGLRINSAKDDAAGLAISERMSGQIRGLNQAVRNANDGVSLSQTAEGSLQTVSDALLRMRELSIQSANASNSGSDRQALQDEVNQLLSEITRIGSTTEFNGTKLFDGNFSAKTFHVGPNASQTISVTINEVSTTALGNYAVTALNATADQGTGGSANPSAAVVPGTTTNTIAAQTLTFSGNFTSTTAAINANDTAEEVASAINGITSTTGVTATATNTVTIDTLSANGTVDFGLASTSSSLTSVSATITTADFGALVQAINDASGNTNVTAALATGTTDTIILTQADGEDILINNFNHTTGSATVVVNGADGGNETLTQGATTDSIIVAGTVTLNSDQSFSVSSSVANSAGSILNTAANTATSAALTQLSATDISTQSGANSALTVIDSALDRVNAIRSELGALQNRFSAAIVNLENVSENLSDARSRIRDADFAQETAELTKNQILQQAGISILATANAQPQNVLALLQ